MNKAEIKQVKSTETIQDSWDAKIEDIVSHFENQWDIENIKNYYKINENIEKAIDRKTVDIFSKSIWFNDTLENISIFLKEVENKFPIWFCIFKIRNQIKENNKIDDKTKKTIHFLLKNKLNAYENKKKLQNKISKDEFGNFPTSAVRFLLWIPNNKEQKTEFNLNLTEDTTEKDIQNLIQNKITQEKKTEYKITMLKEIYDYTKKNNKQFFDKFQKQILELFNNISQSNLEAIIKNNGADIFDNLE